MAFAGKWAFISQHKLSDFLCVSFSSSLNFLLLKAVLVDEARSDSYVKWLGSSDEAERMELPELLTGTAAWAEP